MPCAEHTSTHVAPSEAASQRETPGAINASHISTTSSPTRQRMALMVKDFLGLWRMMFKRKQLLFLNSHQCFMPP